MIIRSPRIWTPQDLCPRCRRPRRSAPRWFRNPRLPAAWRTRSPLLSMAAVEGKGQIDADGKLLIDTDGKAWTDSATDEACCCAGTPLVCGDCSPPLPTRADVSISGNVLCTNCKEISFSSVWVKVSGSPNVNVSCTQQTLFGSAVTCRLVYEEHPASTVTVSVWNNSSCTTANTDYTDQWFAVEALIEPGPKTWVRSRVRVYNGVGNFFDVIMFTVDFADWGTMADCMSSATGLPNGYASGDCMTDTFAIGYDGSATVDWL